MTLDANTYRQKATEGRLKFMRNAPIPMNQLTQLVAVEKLLHHLPSLPARALIENEFQGVREGIACLLDNLQQCCEAAVHLAVLTDLGCIKEWDKELVNLTIGLYEREAQRLLGGFFQLDAPFWEAYHARQSGTVPSDLQTSNELDVAVHLMFHHYGLFFITLDALHHLTALRHATSYQLLLHSLKWALTGYYQPSQTARSEAFHNALRLVDSLDLTDYHDWLIAQTNDLTFSIPQMAALKNRPAL